MEGSLRSYDPLAYYVNNVSDLDHEVVKAHRNSDTQKQKELLSRAKGDFDVFICVNKHHHAFALCVPCGPVDPLDPLCDALSKDPFDIPELELCWRFELCFENEQLRMYKIRKEYALFKDIKVKIERSYYIGSYKGMATMALQFAAMRAAPHRYNAILSDCVEFSKEFCVALLSYCSNWKQLEEQVSSRIKEASATGLSVETLSRKFRTSGRFGNLSLRGADVSSLMSEKSGLVIIVMAFLLLVYPIIVAVVVAFIVKAYT